MACRKRATIDRRNWFSCLVSIPADLNRFMAAILADFAAGLARPPTFYLLPDQFELSQQFGNAPFDQDYR